MAKGDKKIKIPRVAGKPKRDGVKILGNIFGKLGKKNK